MSDICRKGSSWHDQSLDQRLSKHLNWGV